MTQEDKELLLKDLCARLHYGVQVQINIPYVNVDFDKDYDYIINSQNNCILTLSNISEIQKMTDDIKPYLRPMSSMTEEECKYCAEHFGIQSVMLIGAQHGMIMPMEASSMFIDWLNENHFDYRGLIEKGLALEAPEGMYKEWISIRGNLKEDKEGNIVGGLKL